MAGYAALKITGNATGLVQGREEFLLPEDAYPILENAYVWRERIRRRNGLSKMGRLRRVLTTLSLGNSAASPWTFTIWSTLAPPISPETNAEIEPGSVEITIGAIVFTDTGNGTFISATAGNSGVINYLTGVVTLTHTAGAGVATTIDFNYFPGLPVMGLRSRELTGINNEELIAFDQKYAYIYTGGWSEFISGTTWTSSDSEFFWSTNYWVDNTNQKIFWVTNDFNSDPIRYTNGTVWIDFSPTINAAGDLLIKCLCMLPFRGRMVVFNTLEQDGGVSTRKRQRIRWAAIGNPFSDASSIVTTVNANAWRDDIRGQGGFLDIPTSEDIVSVGFVRDNLVIYCERSTWQLRYTGRSIAPFQIEKVNSELGAESTFSTIQFDTSLVGIGDKGVVECDSYRSERIDIKIPDLVFQFNNLADGAKRVQGIRDFQQKLAYWTYAYQEAATTTVKFPNRRLVYNYENDSWAIFTDSLTAFGTYQSQSGLRWNSAELANTTWEQANFPWVNEPALFPSLVAGNQQGFVMFLGSNLETKTTNDPTLSITSIIGNTTTPTVIGSPAHNLATGQVIKISDVPGFFSTLNNQKFGVVVLTTDTFQLMVYNPDTGQFDIPQTDIPGSYVGGGKISVRDDFRVVSKKFNFMDEGQNIQMGFVDALVQATDQGAITLWVYLDYNDDSPINIYPQNQGLDTLPDTFFNSVVTTTPDNSESLPSSKLWKRAFCGVRGAFITLEWTLSNAQLIGPEQESDVQIDAQILYIRRAGRQLPMGV